MVLQIPIYINISTTGVSRYTQGAVNTWAQSWIITIVFIAFVWGIGYVLGGINIKEKDNQYDFPGKDVKYEGFKFD